MSESKMITVTGRYGGTKLRVNPRYIVNYSSDGDFTALQLAFENDPREIDETPAQIDKMLENQGDC